jgi:hypothetical protein
MQLPDRDAALTGIIFQVSYDHKLVVVIRATEIHTGPVAEIRRRGNRKGRRTMIQPKLAAATLILALGLSPLAQAQVTIDVAKITCDQFTLYKVTDPQNIAIWLSGYYHAKRDNTLVDTQQLAANTDKIKTYCRLKPQATVMQAVESVFGPPK